eukprot:SAG11_NODE_2124_length_3784_cov_1.668657_3_plen_123_part_00
MCSANDVCNLFLFHLAPRLVFGQLVTVSVSARPVLANLVTPSCFRLQHFESLGNLFTKHGKVRGDIHAEYKISKDELHKKEEDQQKLTQAVRVQVQPHLVVQHLANVLVIACSCSLSPKSFS